MAEGDPKSLRDLQRVLEISRAMVASEDLDSLLRLIVDCSMELLDAERATVFLYEAERNELVSRIAAGEDVIRAPADRGITGATVRDNATVNVPDAYADSRFNPEIDRLTGFRTRSILSVPLHGYDGKLVGVLQVLNRRDGPFGDYEIALAESLAAQAGVAVQRARLIEHYLVKQELERAMQIARDIQRGLEPQRRPEIAGFDLAGFSEPADDTGGDTYDFMPLADGRWTLSIADATGHGVGPALVIATTRAMLRAVSLQTCDVPTILRTVNRLLNQDLDSGRFVTCFFGVLDPKSCALTYASAGHGPILFYDRRHDRFSEGCITGVPLGVLEEADYCGALPHPFEPGDFAVITTDGFFEAANPAGQQFGVPRMMEVLRQDRDRPAAEMIQRLHAAVTTFTAGRPRADDLTAIAIKRS
jgi:phosphoserine phosphatase